MTAKKATKVDLKRLAAALTDYRFGYLITVDDGQRAHTVAVTPTVCGAVLDVGLVGGGTRNNVAQRGDVTLLWPPREPGGYSLIVDGQAELSETDRENARCQVVPTRALLHRQAAGSTAATATASCLHDCVVFSEPVT